MGCCVCVNVCFIKCYFQHRCKNLLLLRRKRRKLPDSLRKTLKFETCCISRNCMNFVKHHPHIFLPIRASLFIQHMLYMKILHSLW